MEQQMLNKSNFIGQTAGFATNAEFKFHWSFAGFKQQCWLIKFHWSECWL
jgi:hypothetical protein